MPEQSQCSQKPKSRRSITRNIKHLGLIAPPHEMPRTTEEESNEHEQEEKEDSKKEEERTGELE